MKTLRGSISKLRRPKLPLRHPLLGHAWLRQTERYRRQLFEAVSLRGKRSDSRTERMRPCIFCRPTLCVQAKSPQSVSTRESLPGGVDEAQGAHSAGRTVHILHQKRCKMWAWPGGEREGRTAFATSSALPSQVSIFPNMKKIIIKKKKEKS